MKIEYQPSNPIAHYIIPATYLEQHEHSNLHELSCRRARLLKKLFPDNEKYGAKGYGHQNPLMELPLDESDKPGILTEAFPKEQFVSVNATWGNYANYIVRPDDWNSYVEEILALREKLINGLALLYSSLGAYFKKKVPDTILGRRLDENEWGALAKSHMKFPMLPKVAVDSWGITSESTLVGSDNNQSSKFTINLLAIRSQHKAHRDSLKSYVSSLTNFYNQSRTIIMVNGLIGRMPPEQHQSIFSKLEDLGESYSEHLVHLSAVNLSDAHKYLTNMQFEFRNQFSSLIGPNLLSKLEKKEQEKFKKIWPLWFQFAHNPEAVWKDNPGRKAVSIVNIEKSNLLMKIECELGSLESDGLAAKIIDSDIKYDGKKSLWIHVEGCDLDTINDFFTKTVTALTQAIRPLEVRELKYFILTSEWENIVIVPTVQGATLSNSCWVLLSGAFAGEEPVLDEGKAWLAIPRPLEQSLLDNLGLSAVQPIYSSQLSELEKELTSLLDGVSHTSCFYNLKVELNDTGKYVLTNYLSKLLPSLKNHINKIKYICENLESDDEELKQLVKECELAALPYEIPNDNTVNIQLSDCEDWFNILHTTIRNLQIYRWSIIIDAFS